MLIKQAKRSGVQRVNIALSQARARAPTSSV